MRRETQVNGYEHDRCKVMDKDEAWKMDTNASSGREAFNTATKVDRPREFVRHNRCARALDGVEGGGFEAWVRTRQNARSFDLESIISSKPLIQMQ